MATDRRPGGVSPGTLRAIKIAAILMGLLIIGGMAVIVVTLISRATGSGGSGTGTTAVPQAVEASLDLAAGDRIESAVLDGNRVLLVVARAAGGQDVLVVDMRNGDPLLTLRGRQDRGADGETGDE